MAETERVALLVGLAGGDDLARMEIVHLRDPRLLPPGQRAAIDPAADDEDVDRRVEAFVAGGRPQRVAVSAEKAMIWPSVRMWLAETRHSIAAGSSLSISTGWSARRSAESTTPSLTTSVGTSQA